jgi:AcrR family transcriptional regulator
MKIPQRGCIAEAHALPARDTKTALIEAATILFADHGIDAVSVRDITKAAKANIGAITYYFGSKDELIKEVYRASISPRREMRLAALEEYERELNGRQPEAEGILRALVAPTIRAALEPNGRESYAMRLAFQAYALRRPMLDEVMAAELDEFAIRFMNALARATPEATFEEIGWRYYFVIGAAHHIAFDSHRSSRLRRLSGGLCDTSDPERTISQLIEFLMGGIRGRQRLPDASVLMPLVPVAYPNRAKRGHVPMAPKRPSKRAAKR